MLRKAIMLLFSRLEIPLRRLIRFVRLPQKEFGLKASIPFATRLRMLKRGFVSQSYVIYQLHKNDASQYLTDYQMFVRVPDLNGQYRLLLHDKMIFSLMTRAVPAHCVQTFGVIRRGQVHHVAGNKVGDAADYLLDLLQTHRKLVIKPMKGSRGQNIRFLSREGNDLFLNEEPLPKERLRELVGELHDDLISGYVEQCPEIAAFYPRTVNTLRILTMWDVDLNEPFIASALLRIGRPSSYPVDNLSHGGISALVDVETGRLSKGVSFAPENGRLTWYTEHPDSGTQFEGFVLPRWQKVKTDMLSFCRSMPFFQHVGWDLALTVDGFRIIEGNHNPAMRNHQIHRPLLADARVVKFYKRHQIM